jgi:hypothetical protein
VRALFDDGGKRVDEAGPSIPVQVCCYSFSLFIFVCVHAVLYVTYFCVRLFHKKRMYANIIFVILFSCFFHYCLNIQDLKPL